MTVTDLRISLQDLNEMEDANQRTMRIRVPPWAGGYQCGGTFALRRQMEEGTYLVDGHRVDIGNGGWSIEVALTNTPSDPFRATYILAKRVLDLLAAEAFRISEFNDPLREHATWLRNGGELVLSVTTSGRLAVTMRSAMVVRTPTGEIRPQPPLAPRRWHASHAYFRRSQTTDNLHEAYRNLFLALEALLSEVYPWQVGMGERAWLQAALKHVIMGYGLDLSQFVGGSGGNPYKTFMREQYQARRGALFHSKLSEDPTIPGDVATREDLAAATRRLGELYVQLSRLITGATFGGGAMPHAAFVSMVQGMAGLPLYVSDDSDFDLDKCITSRSQLILNAYGQAGLHQLKASWPVADLPPTIRRAGSLVRQGDDLVDGYFTPVDIDTSGLTSLELIIQMELGNAEHLREWFL